MNAVRRFIQRVRAVHDEDMIWKRNTYPDPKAPGFKDTSHLHLPKGVRIPEWSKYEVKNNRRMLEIEQELAKIGLKSPWLRNEVWRPAAFKGLDAPILYCLEAWRLFSWGVYAFIVTEIYFYFAGTYADDGHGHGHDEDDPYPLLYEIEQRKKLASH